MIPLVPSGFACAGVDLCSPPRTEKNILSMSDMHTKKIKKIIVLLLFRCKKVYTAEMSAHCCRHITITILQKNECILLL